jgi:dolichyl-phosphate-mannose--protein O-mannosyl transferase
VKNSKLRYCVLTLPPWIILIAVESYFHLPVWAVAVLAIAMVWAEIIHDYLAREDARSTTNKP